MSGMSNKIAVDQIEDVVVVQPTGELDTGFALELQDRLRDLLDQGARRVAIDFAKTGQIGSVGLRVLLTLGKRLEGMDAGLILCSMNTEVKRAFQVAGLTEQFVVAATPAEAVRQLRAEERIVRLSDRAAELLASAEERDRRRGQDDE
jgi:anti-sigma B factor antagonist